MKTVLAMLCVGVASAAEHIDIMAALHKGLPSGGGHFDILAALHGHHKKRSPAAEDPTGVLGKIMASTQQGLALAEQHHEKAVKVARDQLETALGKEGDTLSAAIHEYDTTMEGALSKLEATKNATAELLEKKEKETASGSWDSSATAGQAQLSAHVSSVERALRAAERKRGSGVREAVSDANLAVEDGVENLGLKLGDISEMVQHVQDKMHGEQDVTSAAGPAAFVQNNIEISADLKSAGAALMAAKTQADATIEGSKKGLADVMNKVQKDMAVTVKSIDDALVAAQKEEFKQVREGTSGGMTPGSLRHHKKH